MTELVKIAQYFVVGRLVCFGVGNYTVSILAPFRLVLHNFYCAPAFAEKLLIFLIILL